MFSIKCDECKGKSWAQSCNWCQGRPYQCFVCNRVITYRDKHDHLLEHFNNPDQYLTCRKCKLYKHNSQFRFKQFFVGYVLKKDLGDGNHVKHGNQVKHQIV